MEDQQLLLELVIETVFFCCLWELFFARALMRTIESWAVKQPFWPYVVKRKGNLSKNGQDDTILMFVLAAHHLIAGTALLAGSYLQNGFLWKHGALMELGFEICDSMAIFRGVWPYDNGRVAPDIRFAMLLHHLPGIFLLFPFIYYEFHYNQHLQAIGGWLLFAGGISALVGGIVYTRDFEVPSQMKQAATAQTIGIGFFMYARWIIFPMEMIELVKAVETVTGIHEHLPLMVKVLGFAMGTFNLAVTLNVVPKTSRYIAKAFFNNKTVDLNDAEGVKKE